MTRPSSLVPRPAKLALLSVSDKSGVVEFARELVKLGFQIISTGGTAALLRKNKIQTTEVADLTGFPEILGGRVKTLHPKIFGGILATSLKVHAKDLQQHGIGKIDLVCVNLYPFAETTQQKNVQLKNAVEKIDIGGVSLLRAAAKNFERVTVVAKPEQYPEVLEKLQAKTQTVEDRRKLAATAFALTAKYDGLITGYLGGETFFTPIYEEASRLRYGENPHQSALLYKEPENKFSNVTNAKVLHGKPLSFNNLVDADFALKLVADFAEPTAAIIKHANPCGVASDAKVEIAFARALEADRKSPFGGVIALNRPLNKKTAEQIRPLFMEVVIAPSFDADALKILREKKNLRLLAVGKFGVGCEANCFEAKKIGGGLLVQGCDARIVSEKDLKVVTKRVPTKAQIQDLIFAAHAVKHAKSNAIVLAKNKVAIGIGAGQTARVDAVTIAIAKAGARASGSVLASDAFFPFPDSVEVAATAGITAIIQPGGSIRDAESIQAADQHNIAMVFTGIRAFRH